MPRQSTQYKQAYSEANYDRLAITIPKGQKSTIETAASMAGDSINAFVNRAILDRLHLQEWPKASRLPDA
ncbi:hypothetical protein AGMMS49992_07430 [Clostridia bacterium]|nr:hypothetical protein AGMMS49992_07430 [Clostridia bacterium]